VKNANLALKFLLELCAFAALAYWGATISIALAIAAPLLAIVLWGLFAAPRSERRLPVGARIPLEMGIFLLSVAALAAAGLPFLAAVLGFAMVANAVLLTAFSQWEA
jgi:hypothetical protein